jgi:hypothetical protein
MAFESKKKKMDKVLQCVTEYTTGKPVIPALHTYLSSGPSAVGQFSTTVPRNEISAHSHLN